MNAANVAAELGGARQYGCGWVARCPSHADGRPSLSLRDGNGGRLLVKCFAGCEQHDVLAELRRRGLLDSGRNWNHRPSPLNNLTKHHAPATKWALSIWREAQPPRGTIVERYLAGRGIALADLPAVSLARLRYHPDCPHPNRVRLPAMVALVDHVTRGTVAIHRTFLKPDGSGKADVDPAKASLGPVGGGAVRLGLPGNDRWLAIAEGIETAASVALTCDLPTWAALSASGIAGLLLPPEAEMLVICADNDASGIGERFAREAAHRFIAEGRRVRLALPPPGSDFNDLLVNRKGFQFVEARHAV